MNARLPEIMPALRKLYDKPGLWLQEDTPLPRIGTREVLIAVTHAGICGTDRHIYEWDAWSKSRVAVGITTAVIPMARGLGFAIPAHTVNWVAPMLMRNGRIERPILGIAARGIELTGKQSIELGQSRAVLVLDVATGEPAERAGMRKGDLVLRANDDDVGSVDDLIRAMVFATDKELALELTRDGLRQRLSVKPRSDRRAA